MLLATQNDTLNLMHDVGKTEETSCISDLFAAFKRHFEQMHIVGNKDILDICILLVTHRQHFGVGNTQRHFEYTRKRDFEHMQVSWLVDDSNILSSQKCHEDNLTYQAVCCC
jgi:hypothetical protein